MSQIDQLRESIDARIVEVKDEMAALRAARAALRTEDAGSKAPAVSASQASPSRRRGPNAAINGADADAPPGARTDLEFPEAPGEPTGPPKPRRRAARRPTASEGPAQGLLAGQLEAMLGEAEDGLSAVTIAKRSKASYRQVLDLLRQLEQAGQLRRSGSRRTSLWRLITDEQRIAERAAELARVSIGTSDT